MCVCVCIFLLVCHFWRNVYLHKRRTCRMHIRFLHIIRHATSKSAGWRRYIVDSDRNQCEEHCLLCFVQDLLSVSLMLVFIFRKLFEDEKTSCLQLNWDILCLGYADTVHRLDESCGALSSKPFRTSSKLHWQNAIQRDAAIAWIAWVAALWSIRRSHWLIGWSWSKVTAVMVNSSLDQAGSNTSGCRTHTAKAAKAQ